MKENRASLAAYLFHVVAAVFVALVVEEEHGRAAGLFALVVLGILASIAAEVKRK